MPARPTDRRGETISCAATGTCLLRLDILGRNSCRSEIALAVTTPDRFLLDLFGAKRALLHQRVRLLGAGAYQEGRIGADSVAPEARSRCGAPFAARNEALAVSEVQRRDAKVAFR